MINDKDLDKICTFCIYIVHDTECETCIIQRIQNMIDKEKEVEK